MDHSPKNETSRRNFLLDMARAGACAGLFPSIDVLAARAESRMAAPPPQVDVDGLKTGWLAPARTYRPHARWAWPGSAVTKDGIAWQLDQMRQQGQGGAEIQIPWTMYSQGNIPYLSEEWLEMVKYAIGKAAELDMEMAMTFGPGWTFGGYWVPPTERSKVLTQAWVDVTGPGVFSQPLPAVAKEGPAKVFGGVSRLFHSDAPDENLVVAVVAGGVAGSGLKADTLIDLSGRVNQDRLDWLIPSGQWRVMVYRLKYTGQPCPTTENFDRPQWVVDHLSKKAMSNFCNYLGGVFYQAFGEEFGRTLDSMFCDSFEMACLPDALLWSNDTLERFAAYKGYDLTPYLPALWWDIGELTPRIRYDVNEFLSWLGLDTVFTTFNGWCEEHNVQARIQPHYRFTEEIIQGAGMTHRPETEVTTTRFAVVTDPRKATAAGAHLYGRQILSAEAYTFIHTERYRTTLEELKIATDAFLRDGVTQFFNIEYHYSPEMHVAPSRDLPWANRISPWNVWWKHYHHLAEYVSRCCYLLRQGSFAADVLLYSPQATVWTEKVLFVNERRVMPYGDVGNTLVANGYDFDPVNDDVLQHRAQVKDGHIKVRDLTYRFLILPNTTAVPVATLEFIRQFVLGGGILVALGELPKASVGLEDHAQNDARVKQIVSELFGPDGRGRIHPGGGQTYHIGDYKIPGYEFTQRNFSPGEQPYQRTPALEPPQQALLKALRSHLAPDFALAGDAQSDGLTFIHRRIGPNDLYFVTNLQPAASQTAVTFRAAGKVPEEWDPMTGEIRPNFVYTPRAQGVEVPLNLPAHASTFLMFKPGPAQAYVSETNLDEVVEVTARHVKGSVASSGKARVTVVEDGKSRSAEVNVASVPKPFEVTGNWQLVLEGYEFPRQEKAFSGLESWTANPESEHFSGTGRYDLDFQLPSEYVSDEIELVLDLGSVGSVAEVLVNSRNVGVAWMPPYQLRVTEALRSGGNHLTVLVTNTLINSVSGMSKLPDVPEELIPHYGPTANLYESGTAEWERHEKGFHPLPPSGLLGPVRLLVLRKVTVALS